MQDFTFFLGIILVVLLGLYFSIRFIRPQQLTKHEKQFLQKHWKQIESQPDHKHAIIDADKLLDKALHMKNKKGTLWEKLKKEAKLFQDINGIWWAHKLRNTLAHEIGATVSEKEYNKAMKIFKKALIDLGM